MTAPTLNPKTDHNITPTSSYINTLNNDHINIITTHEIQKNIDSLQNKKAPGHDKITNNMLKLISNNQHFFAVK